MRPILFAIAISTAVNFFFVPGANAHPLVAGNEHGHDGTVIQWEFDGVKDGNSAHNHYDSLTFNGAELYTQPAGAGACWDNQNVRVDPILDFRKGHCFINSATLNGRPAYYFEGNWPASAKARVRDAFDEYNGIFLISSGYRSGIGFDEVGSSIWADVVVKWQTLSPDDYGGAALLHESAGHKYLYFDSSRDWSYQKSTSGVPSDKWHFFSVALHEVGHVFGLGHQPAGDLDDVMNGPVGTPMDGYNGYDGRHFDQVDDDSVFGVIRLYTQPISPPPSCEPYFYFTVQACEGNQNNTQITATLPGFEILNINYQIKPGGLNSPWPFQVIYDGEVSTCPIASTLGNFYATVTMETVFGFSTCGIPIHIDVCEEEGGGFPQF